MAVVGARHATHLHDVVARTRPVARADDQLLPVAATFDGLLPWSGLRRGATFAVTGAAATSLALALAADASKAGSWCAAVGLPSLGLLAAVEAGIELARFPMVAASSTGREWASVVAAVVDALDIVLVRPPGRVGAADARRLTARARERGAVLVSVGAPWEGADVRLDVREVAWHGLGRGHGHLRARRVDVIAEGRGAAARPRRASLWLPDADGELRRAADRRPDLHRETTAAEAACRPSPGRAVGRREVRVAG